MESLEKTVRQMTIENLEDLEDFEADVSKSLECPVCYTVPRSGPVPSCSAGHIVCSSCRKNLSECPMCRRPLSDDHFNSLATTLIEKIKHKCKYTECEETDFLKRLEYHEKICPERIITCPYLNCREKVKFKNYRQHSLNGTSYEMHLMNLMHPMGQKVTCTSKALVDTEEYRTDALDIEKHCFKMHVSYCKRPILVIFETIRADMGINRDIPYSSFLYHRFVFRNQYYYLHSSYSQREKLFSFYVITTESREDMEYLNVSIALKSEDRKLEDVFNTQIVPIDEAPITETELFKRKEVWLVSEMTMVQKYYIHQKENNYFQSEEGFVREVQERFDLFISIS